MFFMLLQILKHLGGDMDCLQFSGSGVFNVSGLCQDLENR